MRFASQEKPALSSLQISQQGKRTHQLRHSSTRFIFHCLFLLGVGSTAFAQQQDSTAPTYLSLSTPQRVLPTAQAWEGKEFPHTLSVLELNRDGFRYWGWYGLNEGKGIGLARSNDLVHWTKYEKNPLWTNARWPSVLDKADPTNPKLLYFAIAREYDTPNSHIVLATSLLANTTHRTATLCWPLPSTGSILRKTKFSFPVCPTSATRIPISFAISSLAVFTLPFIAVTTMIVSRLSAVVQLLLRTSTKLPKKFLSALRRQLRLLRSFM